jgi:hypothetical protein
MPPSSYKKEKLILKIYIRLLLYIKDKYNEILNPTALLQHFTDEINLINQDRALDKTFYDLFTTAAQIELETAKKRELETAKKRVLETVTKIETQEDVKSRMRKYMEELIDTMKKKGYTPKVDNSQPFIDTLTFPKKLNDLTTLFEILREEDNRMQTTHKDADQTTDIGNTMRIIGILYRKVETIIENTKQAGRQAERQAERAERVERVIAGRDKIDRS